MKTLPIIAVVTFISACSSNSPSHTNMSATELAAYNLELPPELQIHCVREATPSSYIRKRKCQSYEDWLTQNERAAARLEVLNTRRSYNIPDTILQDGPVR
jgi:hypothetical protein